MDQDPQAVALALEEVVVAFGLRRAEAATDTHVIRVEEPGLWVVTPDLVTTVREIDR